MSEPTETIHCPCGAEVPPPAKAGALCPRCAFESSQAVVDASLSETAELPRSVPMAVVSSGEAGPSEGAAAAKAAGLEVDGGSPPGQERSSLVGQRLDHFQVMEELGRGGVGTVYRALDTSLDREVALKVLNVEGNPQALEAFVHEARAQARLNHPGIATIHYIGRRGPTPYFAMEYVAGESLESRVGRGPVAAGEVIRIGIQAVQALREANSRGITHRDIKPGNFILSKSGTVKLTDFGLSKSDRGGLDLTGKHSITGTPYYIAPEQARGESTDLRTDIYSLGAMLFHLAYGRPPFGGDNFLAVISKHLSSPVEIPANGPEDIPLGFMALLERMLSKDPRERLPDYDSLERALHELLPENQIVAGSLRRLVAAFLEWVALGILPALAEGIHDLSHLALGGAESGKMDVAHFAAVMILIGMLVLQVLRGRTPGKVFAHLCIAAILGGRPGRRRLAIRWIFQWLPFIAILTNIFLQLFFDMANRWLFLVAFSIWIIDLLWAFTNRRRRTFHDIITGTWVLEDRLND